MVDACHLEGVGTALLERLRERARAYGVTALTGHTAAGNRAAARMLGHSTRVVSEDPRTGTLAVTVRLDGHAPEAPVPRPAR